jgi:hypothetical protein
MLTGVTDSVFMPADPGFIVVLRGYDRAEVDAVIRLAHDALASDDAGLRAEAVTALRDATFARRLRGYDSAMVDYYLTRLGMALAT